MAKIEMVRASLGMAFLLSEKNSHIVCRMTFSPVVDA